MHSVQVLAKHWLPFIAQCCFAAARQCRLCLILLAPLLLSPADPFTLTHRSVTWMSCWRAGAARCWPMTAWALRVAGLATERQASWTAGERRTGPGQPENGLLRAWLTAGSLSSELTLASALTSKRDPFNQVLIGPPPRPSPRPPPRPSPSSSPPRYLDAGMDGYGGYAEEAALAGGEAAQGLGLCGCCRGVSGLLVQL